MNCVILFVILIIVVKNIDCLTLSETALKFTRPRLGSATNVPADELDNIASIAYLYSMNPNPNEWVGNGIIINKYYIVTCANLSSFTVDYARDMLMKAYCLDINNCDAGVQRRIYELKSSPDCSGFSINSGNPGNPLKCIYLLRVCPSFPSITYTITINQNYHPYYNFNQYEMVNMYQYDSSGILQRASKQFGEYCECSDLPNFDKEFHVCLANSPLVYGDFTDQGKCVIITRNSDGANGIISEYLGFLVKTEDKEGEIVLWLTNIDLREWIEVNSNVNNWNYPV